MRYASITFGLIISFVSSAQFTWEQRSSLPGSGLWGPASFVIDGIGYVVSGRANGVEVADVWAYDPESDTWSQREPIPLARRVSAGFAINGKGYVSCGTYGSSSKLNDLWEYDPVNDTWTQRSSFPGDARYGVCSFVLGGKGYVGTGNIGTATGPYVSDMYAYDPVTDSWTAKASMPGLTRYGTSTITAGGRAYVFGGLMSNQQHTGDIYEYNPGVDSWTLLAPFPGSTRTYAMALSYTFDGVIAAGKGSSGLNIYDGFQYIPNLNIWSEIPDYPGGSGWVGATAAINGRSFGGLGLSNSSGADFNDWWELVKGDNSILEPGPGAGDPLELYPNPVAPGESIRISTARGGQLDGSMSVSLLSLTGQVTEFIPAPQGMWRCPEVVPGLYVVNARGRGGRIWTGRLVVSSE